MKTPKEIESLAERMRFEPDASVDERVFSAAQAALNDRMETARVGETRLKGRWIMRTPIAKLAIAATVLVAAWLGTHLFHGTSGITWADVLEKVNALDTCTFRTRLVETTGPRPDGFEFTTERESRVCRSEANGSFTENYEDGGLVTREYCLLQDRQGLTFTVQDKTCRRSALDEKAIGEFDYYSPRRLVVQILRGDYTEIGEEIIEGRPVIGVELRDPNVFVDEEHPMPPMDDFFVRAWVRPQTLRPVWVEMSAVPKGSSSRMTMVWDQFQWGMPLEVSLFHPEIPADYQVVDDVPRDYPAAPDPTPETEAEKAFVQNSIAEPYLSDFDHLSLPDVNDLSLLGIDPQVARPPVRLLGDAKIRAVHDVCVVRWPGYEQVRSQLLAELQTKLDIDAMDVNSLVTTGIALRNRFWERGGCLSETGYPYIYAARLLDEIAHEKAPENSAVIDQLLESIMAYEVLYYWKDPAPETPESNAIYDELIVDLRRAQHDLLKAKVSQGYVPTWKDFVRSCDFAYLCSRTDPASALEVTRLLVEQTPKAGWTYYLDRLQRGEQGLAASPVTFVGGISEVQLDQYARRLWSFQGPREFRESRVPTHLKDLKNR